MRRRTAIVGEVPKPKLPWIGKPVEYVPRAGKALPAVYVAGVGAVSTPSSAALCFARRVVARRLKRRAVAEAAEARDDGPQLKRRAAAEAGEATGDGPQPLTADEARAAAAAEGLELEPSSSSETGFNGVKKAECVAGQHSQRWRMRCRLRVTITRERLFVRCILRGRDKSPRQGLWSLMKGRWGELRDSSVS